MRVWSVTQPGAGSDPVGEAACLLDAGGVLLIPTETYYGLAARADVAAAVSRVFRCKGRPPGKPLPLLVTGVAMARALAPAAPTSLETLAEAFWPGPLTLVLPPAAPWPEGVCATGGGIAVRHSSHPVAAALVARVGAPLTATSANVAGAPPARRLGQVLLQRPADGAIDAGETPGGPPSTVLDLCGRPRILRAGAIEREPLERALGTRLL